MSRLKVENLAKSYNGRSVVNDINIEINRGEIVGLLGPNGAGKTTSFYMIVGLIRPDKGRIMFDDKDITQMPMYKRARLGIGYLCQDDSVFRKLTVEENIMAVLETLNIPMRERKNRLEKLLSELKISHLGKNKAYTLSGGERRRLEITRALVTEPSFLLLDEPFSGIDPIAVFEAQQIIQDLKQGGLGILLTDHSVRETLAITDRSYIMYEGRILISGTSNDLISSPKARQIYLGEKFTL
ncbi:MAG: LPS export ABC transporter ATP-binding protein [Candidatus Omnitrophica bacterium]|nr:LPS export ABC transporter ATP-binding protein [Candidatus Omnitrophota bacterium]